MTTSERHGGQRPHYTTTAAAAPFAGRVLFGARKPATGGECSVHATASPGLAPWIRGGFDYACGDNDPNDRVHGTFFQLLPTPRLYARFPFFNLMNSTDTFFEWIVRPSSAFTVRIDVHFLELVLARVARDCTLASLDPRI
jgi:hypothetical protein